MCSHERVAHRRAHASCPMPCCLLPRPGCRERDDAGGQSPSPPLLRVIAAGHLEIRDVVPLRLESALKTAICIANARPDAAERAASLELADVERESNVLLGRCRHLLREPFVWRIVRAIEAAPQRA